MHVRSVVSQFNPPINIFLHAATISSEHRRNSNQANMRYENLKSRINELNKIFM